MNPEIIFEDEDLVAIMKPAGVMTHPDGHNTEETASDWFARAYPASKDVGEMQRLKDGTEIARPGVVHRLDRDTSGVLVFAKTQGSHARLKDAFQNRLAKKTYLALTYGVPREPKGVIDFAIGRSRKDFRLRSAQPRARGTMRDALTRYEVLSDIGTHALIKAMPETGRTHQIRVHLKAIHHPVVSDPLYAPGRPNDFKIPRLALHAYQLALPGKPLLTAPVPGDIAPAFKRFPGGEQFIAP